MSKLPNFDELSITKVYNLENDDDDFEDYEDETFNADEQNSDDADEKNDFNNFGPKADDEKTLSLIINNLLKSQKKKVKNKILVPEQYDNKQVDVAQKLLNSY